MGTLRNISLGTAVLIVFAFLVLLFVVGAVMASIGGPHGGMTPTKTVPVHKR